MTEFINNDGESLVYNGRDFAITKQSISFVDFKIKGDVSVNFQIPNTSKNRDALGYYGMNQVPNGALSRKTFNLFRNGNKILSGYIYIQKDNIDTIECFFLSGNSNWISLFQFSCKEIRNPSLSINWQGGISIAAGGDTAYYNRNNKQGIVFPIIDYTGQGKIGQDIFSRPVNITAGELYLHPRGFDSPLYPCLWMHTLVNEISKVAGVIITGDLMTDPVYQSLIITPEGPELTDPETNMRIFQQMSSTDNRPYENHLVTIGAIAPSFKAIEVIKYLCISFGCIPEYDINSKTLTLTKSKSIKKEDALDLSEYIRSYTLEYNDLKSSVSIEYSQPSDLDYYNSSNETSWGSLKIETGRQDNGNSTAYKSPFLASYHYVNQFNGGRTSLPYVCFWELNLDFSTDYSTITNVTSPTLANIRFGGLTDAPAFNREADNMVEIIDNGNTWTGFYRDTNVETTHVDIIIQHDDTNNFFTGSTSGTVRVYSLSPSKQGPRILRCKTDVPVTSFTNFTQLKMGPNIGPDSATDCSIAWFSKYAGRPDLNDETSINYGDINDSNFTDVNLGETHLQPVISMIKNVPVRGRFLIPESMFASFEHSRWVYINNGELNGYFYAHKIENFVDSQNECVIELLKVG